MNKLASIEFLHELGLPTINPRIIYSTDEKKIRKSVDSFYYDFPPGWALRCAELPDKKGKVERGLPWAMTNGKENLVKKIIEIQKQVKGKYVVFCHEVKEMERGAIMLIEGNRIVVEAGKGNPKELSDMFRGYRSPEQRLIFRPGMLSLDYKDGQEVLSREDLFDARCIERNFDYKKLGAIINPVAVEFSKTKTGLYVHDVSIN